MRRLLVGSVAAGAMLALGLVAGPARATPPDCDEPTALCTEPVDSIGYSGAYTGHDEPSLLFYSNAAGSGNSNFYHLQIPTDPKMLPKQDGPGTTWNFQLHPAFWFGMALCDNQSAPEFTHAPCTPDSDTNIFDGTDPAGRRLHRQAPRHRVPGAAVLPAGLGALAARRELRRDEVVRRDGDLQPQPGSEHGLVNNADCLNTRRASSRPTSPSSRRAASRTRRRARSPRPPRPFTPSAATDLFMSSGDRLTIDIHDAPAGLTAIIHDLTTGQTGSMTASVANGFAQILFEPNSTTCHKSPYTFRPMYATSSEHTRVPWAAHTYNVAFSDEIGHFEYCNAVTAEGGDCTSNSEARARRRRRRLLQPSVLAARPRSAAASPPTTTSTGLRTRRSGRD